MILQTALGRDWPGPGIVTRLLGPRPPWPSWWTPRQATNCTSCPRSPVDVARRGGRAAHGLNSPAYGVRGAGNNNHMPTVNARL